MVNFNFKEGRPEYILRDNRSIQELLSERVKLSDERKKSKSFFDKREIDKRIKELDKEIMKFDFKTK